MGSKKQIKGTCLCGTVNISIETENGTFDVCHCGMCRKWGGGPAFTIDSGKRFDISGKESVATYKSSEWAERGFCKNCGTHLFYRLLEADFYNFSFGLFESIQEFKFQSQIFIDSKPHSYEFANITEKLTETTVTLTGDRITSIQGLKASGDLRLELGFESGPRTEQNPWGVYISREKEFQ